MLGFRSAAYVLVLIAFIFVVVGLATPSPTRVGMESKLAQGPDIARGMVRITRHPFLWGVALWALVHLIVNGDLASLILFGSLLVLALGGTAAIDAKRRRSFGEQWMQFAAMTSNVPLAAVVAGKNRLGPAVAEIGVWRPLVAIVMYAVAFYLHGRGRPTPNDNTLTHRARRSRRIIKTSRPVGVIVVPRLGAPHRAPGDVFRAAYAVRLSELTAWPNGQLAPRKNATYF